MRVGGESGNDGTIEVVTLQVIHSHKLPGLITQLHRGDLRIRREETWGPVTGGAATGVGRGCRSWMPRRICRAPPILSPTTSPAAPG